MQPRYQASRLEIGCLVTLWILSPLAVLYVWLFTKTVLFIQWSVHEDMRGRYEATLPPWSDWIEEWWHQGWWLIILGGITIPFLVLLYLWVLMSTGRIIHSFGNRQES
jgi:hypothetical protein